MLLQNADLLSIFRIPCTALSSVLLLLFIEQSALMTALLMALLVGCMQGIYYMLIILAPRQFRRFGRVSLVSGALNSCSHIGSALSVYGFALLSETLGWKRISLMRALIAGEGSRNLLAHFKGMEAVPGKLRG